MSRDKEEGGVSSKQIAMLGVKRPKIRDFLSYVHENQDESFRSLWYFGGLEFVFDYEDDFKTINVSGGDLAGCMDGNHATIKSVCTRILQAHERSVALQEQGETHLASRGLELSPTAAKAFVLACFDALERHETYAPIPELHFLLSTILFPSTPEKEALRASRELKYTTALLASAYLIKHKKLPSFRRLAKILDVAPSTISRLFESQSAFENEVRGYSTFFDPRKHVLWAETNFGI